MQTSYLTEAEKTLLMIEWPAPSDVLGYSGVSRTQLSIARHSGAAVINGRRYTYVAESDELLRDDALAMVRKWRKEDAALAQRLEAPTMAQASLLDGDGQAPR